MKHCTPWLVPVLALIACAACASSTTSTRPAAVAPAPAFASYEEASRTVLDVLHKAGLTDQIADFHGHRTAARDCAEMEFGVWIPSDDATRATATLQQALDELKALAPLTRFDLGATEARNNGRIQRFSLSARLSTAPSAG